MKHRYELVFIWPGGRDPTGSGKHFIEAEAVLDAIRGAEAYWRAQSFAEWPLGFDLFDRTGQPVHQFRSGRQPAGQNTAK